MSVLEITYWTMWAFMLLLFLVLYLRVDWHDWGAVGMTGVIFGIFLLLSGVIYRYYGGQAYLAESLVLWRVLVLGFAPFAIAGYVAGLVRDPVPVGQIARRLIALTAVVALLLVIIDLIGRRA